MSDPSPSRSTHDLDTSLPPSEVVEQFRALVEAAPEAASARIDDVADVVDACRAVRRNFVNAVADLIIALPPEGARYPAQVLADLVDDDAALIRDEATEAVADLAAAVGPAHLRQVEVLLEAVYRRLGSNDDDMIREQAGAACLTFALTHADIGLPFVAMVLHYVEMTVPTRAEQAVKGVLDRLAVDNVPTHSVAPAD